MNVWRTVCTPEQPRFPFGTADPELADKGRTANKGSRALLVSFAGLVSSAWGWFQRARAAQIGARRLRVAETVSLGEKRFVSIIQVDSAQFLIGGSATTVQLLARLDSQSSRTAAALLEEQDPA